MKQLLLFAFGLLLAISTQAQGDPTLRMHQNLQRSGNYRLFSKQDSAKLANAASGGAVDTTLLATKAFVTPKIITLTSQVNGLSTSLSSKLNYSDTTLFVRKLNGTRLLTNTEAAKLNGLPSSAVDATTYSTNRTADLQTATNPANLVQTATYRFTSDTEKAAWSAKLGASDLKTINGIPIPGTGDIVITGGTGAVTTNATSLTAGILDDARLSGNIVKTSGTYSNPGFITALDAAKVTTGTLSNSRLAPTVTLLGNSFNGTSQLVQLDGTGKLPAVDGSLLTGLDATKVTETTTRRFIPDSKITQYDGYSTQINSVSAVAGTASTNASAALSAANSATAALGSKQNTITTTTDITPRNVAVNGVLTAPSPATSDSTTKAATTDYVKKNLQAAILTAVLQAVKRSQDSLSKYGTGFDVKQFVRVDTVSGSDSISFIRIKSSILGISTGTGSGTVAVDQSLSASSTNAVSNAAATNAINANISAIATNTTTINTLVGATLTPTVTNLTASNVTTTGLTLNWGVTQTTVAEAIITNNNSTILGWVYSQSFRLVSASRDANGAITTASIIWPDGNTGTFTTLTPSTAFPGAIDSYRVTYIKSGVTTTYTQPAVTRDSSGAVSAQPSIIIS